MIGRIGRTIGEGFAPDNPLRLTNRDRPVLRSAPMVEHPEITIVHTAKSAFEAEVIAGVLREAGIPVYVAGQHLQDEFALSQMLANLLHIQIQVPADRADDARKALAAADESSKLLDSGDFDPGEPDDPADGP